MRDRSTKHILREVKTNLINNKPFSENPSLNSSPIRGNFFNDLETNAEVIKNTLKTNDRLLKALGTITDSEDEAVQEQKRASIDHTMGP